MKPEARHKFQLLEQFKLPSFSSDEEAREFWSISDARKFSMRRFFLFFGALAFMAHGMLDLTAAGDQGLALLLMRVASVLIMLTLAAAFTVGLTRFQPDTIVIGYLIVPSVTIVAMTVMVDAGTAADTYPFGLVILFAYGGTVLVPRFSKLLALCLIVSALYFVITPFAAISDGALIVNAFFLSVGMCAICIGSLTRERLERQQVRIEQSITELNYDLELSREEAIHSRDAAVAARRTQAKFITSISHELRTPLNAIIGFSDLMINQIDGPVTPASYKEYIEDIHRSGQGLLLNINDMLDVHRLNARKMSWTDERFSVREMVRNAVVVCQHEADAAGVTLTSEPPEIEVAAYGDTHRMTQIVTNLLTNAIKFTDPGGHVSVAQTLEPSGEVCISVKDNGIGIAAKDLVRIQSPFQQAEDGSVAKRKGGLGLGLSIVSGILEHIDGRFEMESALGVGTSCYVYLPKEKLFLDDASSTVALAT